MSYSNDLESRVASEAPSHLVNHVIEALKMDGLYRHWRCQEPDNFNRYFEIVTWPGSICFTGDMGEYLFQRCPDMVLFMRRSALSYQYAAEKCVANDGRLRKWEEGIFRETLAEVLDGAKQELGDSGDEEDFSAFNSIREKIEEIESEFSVYESEHDAIRAMYELDLWDEIPDCKCLTYHFLWCLHAIKWFCDNVKDA